MKKIKQSEMVPGRRYRGYGMVNEYREFSFTPEQTGSRQGETKYIYQSEDVAISETKNLVIFRMTVRKSAFATTMALVQILLSLFEKSTKIIKDYEI